MAYTLKTSGVAVDAAMVLAVDEGGVIREFVSATVNANKTIDSGVVTGTSSWKSVTRGYFETLANGTFGFFGIRFGASAADRPQLLAGAGCALFVAAAQLSAGGGRASFFETGDGNHSVIRNGTSKGAWAIASGERGTIGTTTLPTATKFSFGTNRKLTDNSAWFYGLESGSLAADGSGSSGGFGGDSDTDPTTKVAYIGGSGAEGGNQPGRYHVVAIFNRELTLAEFQSLHDDWFGTLFDGPLSLPISSRRKKPAIHPGQNPASFGRFTKTRRNTYVSPDRTAALTGTEGVGALGTLAPSTQAALAGAAAAGAAGTVSSSSDSTVALTGVGSSAVVGTVVPTLSTALTGTGAVGETGSVAAFTTILTTGSRRRTGAMNPGDRLLKLGRFNRTRRNTSTIPSATGTITGVQATGSVGTVTPAITLSLIGAAASGVAGTLGSSAAPREGSRRKAGGVYPCTGPYSFARYYKTRRNTESLGTAVQSINGVAATSGVGSVVSSRTVALTGAAATGGVGSVGASKEGNATLTTVSGVVSVGTIVPGLVVALAGVQVTGAVGTLAPVTGLVIALTGVQATGSAGVTQAGHSQMLAGVSASATIGTMIGGTPGTWVPVNSLTSVEGWTPINT